MTLQYEVQEDLVKLFGLDRIRKFFDEELAYQRFKLLEIELQAALGQAKDVNWEKEFDQARQQAFEEYMNRRKQNA
mgnify:FL=1